MPKRKKKQISRYAHTLLRGELTKLEKDMRRLLRDFREKMHKKIQELKATVDCLNSGPGG
jgi:predicted transcriptional regulator